MIDNEYVTACVEARFRVGFSEERPRRVEYKALGCGGCNRPFGSGHDDWCQVRDPGPDPIPVQPIATLPTEQLCEGPCGQVMPATTEHFQRNPKHGLRKVCKICHAARVTAGLERAGVRTKGRYGEGVA